jgi:hypothetical protein
MYSSNRTFDLNTAVSDARTTDEKAHAALIKPLYDRIMDGRDGVLKCYIGLYEIKVTFVEAVISADEVRGIVEEAVEWAAQNVEGMFPLRGDKHPAIIKPERTSSPKTNKVAITALCKTSALKSTRLLPYYPSRTEVNGYDAVQAARETYPLRQAMTRCEGVQGCRIGSDGVRLIIDTDYVTVGAAKDHITRVLNGAKRSRPVRLFWACMSTVTNGRVSRRDYFPFIKDTTVLIIDFKVEDE